MRFDFSFRAASALVLVTCNPTGFESLGAAFHSSHFDYLYHPDDSTVCFDVMDSLERHQQLIAHFLGIDERNLPRVTYWKLRDENEYQAHTPLGGGDALANANKDFVLSPLPFDEHELIHTITLGAWGYTARFLEEGIAVALSCDPSAVDVTNTPYTHWDTGWDLVPFETAPEKLAFGDTETPTAAPISIPVATMYEHSNYQAAGAITTYLLDVGGSAKLQKLWTSVSAGSSASDFSKALQSIYGLSLDDVWQSLLTTRHRPCTPVWMCSLPAITASEQGTLRSTCTGKDLGRPTNGNLRLQFPLWSNRAVEMAWCIATNCIGGPTPSVASSQLPVTAVSMIACDGDPSHQLPRDPQVQLVPTMLPDNLKADTWIPPLSTSHVVMIEQFAWVISNLQSVYNTPAGSLPYATQSLVSTNTRCSEAQANAIDDGTASSLWMPNDSQTHFARFRLNNPETLFPYFGLYVSVYGVPEQPPPAGSGLTVELCSACNGDDATQCDGCPNLSADCIVKFQNSSSAPTWLRLVNRGPSPNGSVLNTGQWATSDTGDADVESDAGVPE